MQRLGAQPPDPCPGNFWKPPSKNPGYVPDYIPDNCYYILTIEVVFVERYSTCLKKLSILAASNCPHHFVQTSLDLKKLLKCGQNSSLLLARLLAIKKSHATFIYYLSNLSNKTEWHQKA